jgi:raffinose/stachyose/melibiose transport system permease protein
VRPGSLLGFRMRARVGINIVMMLIVLVLVTPLWYVLNNAFKVEQEILRRPLVLLPAAATLDNLARSFTAMKYPVTFMNSAVVLVLSCTFLISLGSLAAFGIAMAKSRFLNIVYIVLVAMITLPFQLAMVPLIFLLKSLHLVNTYLGIALIYSGWFLPFVIFLYVGFIRTVPRELEEAGRVDGCGLLRSFISIYIPLLKSITGTVLILRGVPVWNDLLVPIITITRSTMSTLPLRLYSFVGTPGSSAIRWTLVFGSTFIVSLPILLVFLFLQRFFVRGAAAGAVKG